MARRREVRRFGRGPYVLGLRRDDTCWGTGFPFDVPAVAASEDLCLDTPVTLLAGDNGSGKSTLAEAIAEAMGFAAEGGELERSGELPAVPRPVMGGGLVPVLSRTRPRTGYFLRAESFFNVARFVDSDDLFAPDLSLYDLAWGDSPSSCWRPGSRSAGRGHSDVGPATVRPGSRVRPRRPPRVTRVLDVHTGAVISSTSMPLGRLDVLTGRTDSGAGIRAADRAVIAELVLPG